MGLGIIGSIIKGIFSILFFPFKFLYDIFMRGYRPASRGKYLGDIAEAEKFKRKEELKAKQIEEGKFLSYEFRYNIRQAIGGIFILGIILVFGYIGYLAIFEGYGANALANLKVSLGLEGVLGGVKESVREAKLSVQKAVFGDIPEWKPSIASEKAKEERGVNFVEFLGGSFIAGDNILATAKVNIDSIPSVEKSENRISFYCSFMGKEYGDENVDDSSFVSAGGSNSNMVVIDKDVKNMNVVCELPGIKNVENEQGFVNELVRINAVYEDALTETRLKVYSMADELLKLEKENPIEKIPGVVGRNTIAECVRGCGLTMLNMKITVDQPLTENKIGNLIVLFYADETWKGKMNKLKLIEIEVPEGYEISDCNFGEVEGNEIKLTENNRFVKQVNKMLEEKKEFGTQLQCKAAARNVGNLKADYFRARAVYDHLITGPEAKVTILKRYEFEDEEKKEQLLEPEKLEEEKIEAEP